MIIKNYDWIRKIITPDFPNSYVFCPLIEPFQRSPIALTLRGTLYLSHHCRVSTISRFWNHVFQRKRSY